MVREPPQPVGPASGLAVAGKFCHLQNIRDLRPPASVVLSVRQIKRIQLSVASGMGADVGQFLPGRGLCVWVTLPRFSAEPSRKKRWRFDSSPLRRSKPEQTAIRSHLVCD